MSIGWGPSMETGAPLLDAQRRALVERADALLATIESGRDRSTIERALRDFGDYSVRHFSQEEDCALRGVCPAIEWNGAARAELITIMAGLPAVIRGPRRQLGARRRSRLRTVRLGRPLHPRPGDDAALRRYSEVGVKSRAKPG